MRTTISAIAAALALSVAVGTQAAPARLIDNPRQTTQSIDNTTFIDANEVLMFVTNHGSYGRDLSGLFGYDYGTFFPFTGVADILSGSNDKSPLYAAGIWLGGVDDATDDTVVAIAEYTTEYVPGPMSGGTYQPDEPAFRVYKLYGDSLASNPNQDYLDWPEDQGAPVDAFGDPEMLGDQMTWAVYNDADASAHTNSTGETAPLGIEIHQSTFAFDRAGALGGMVFMRYLLFNRGSRSLSDFCISVWIDPDLGFGSDDLVGCDSLESVGFCYNATNSDGVYGSTPPALGVKCLRGPLVASPGDTAEFDGVAVLDYRNAVPSSFNAYIGGADPASYREAYHLLNGMAVDGQPYVYDALVRHFKYSGDPVAGTGDLDPNPTDKRFMFSFGPLDFNPGDSQYVLFVLGAAQSTDRLSSLTLLRTYFDDLVGIPTGTEEPNGPALPEHFEVSQNYPNPFNPGTKIMFSLPERSDVSVNICNILGQRVRTLFGGTLSAGKHTVEWDGTDDSGAPVASGVYFYRVAADDKIISKKMMLTK